MGKAGRFACIFLPMALTLASLICLILVFAGQTNKNMPLSRDLYFFKANLQEFNADPSSIVDKLPKNVQIDNELLQALQGAAQTNELKDFYQVGLWNYCEGDIRDNKEHITFCSPRKSNFWFNPLEVWQLENTTAQKIFTDELKHGLDVYHKAAKWMFTAFVVTAVLTVAEFIVGIFAVLSRWGSLVTTVVSSVQTVFFLAAAATATAIYVSLVAVFHTVFQPYNIKASLGSRMMATLWLGVAFSVASGFFWLISVCCCSGKSPHKKVAAEKTPYTYERVASPYLGARESSGHQLGPVSPAAGHGTSGHSFEPYRQHNV